MNYNYYVIGGQYARFCYGGSNTLNGAKQLATKCREYWDNWQGWNTPRIYAAEDCVIADTEFFNEQVIPKAGTFPIVEYDNQKRRWINCQ